MAQKPPPDAAIIDLLRKTRSLVAFHQALGIGEYPLQPELKTFLDTRGEAGGALKTEEPRPTWSAPKVTAKKKTQREASGGQPASIVTLTEIREELGECTRCSLHLNRTSVVFGMGSESARLLIIGDSPGNEDDRQGEPFQGEAGELLDKMLAAIGLARKNVYLATLVKCPPPDGGTPSPEEISACLPILHRQIAAVSPAVICTMGALSTQTILNTTKQLIHLRGRFHSFQGIPLMPTFPPDFLIRNPELKKAAWLDLQKIKKKCS